MIILCKGPRADVSMIVLFVLFCTVRTLSITYAPVCVWVETHLYTVLGCDWQHCNQWAEAQTGPSSSRQYAMILEALTNQLMQTMRTHIDTPMVRRKMKGSATFETSCSENQPNQQHILSFSVWACLYFCVYPKGMTLMLHTHCFAKLMDLLECLQWAWKPEQLEETVPEKRMREEEQREINKSLSLCTANPEFTTL